MTKTWYEIEGYNRKITAYDFKKSAEFLAREKCGTVCMYLDMDRNGQDIAIVIGWQNGFDESEQDSFSDGKYRLCAKIGYQNRNSMMQCDYDIDWYMPWDKKTGNCIDSEIVLYEDSNFNEVLKDLEKSWKWIDKNWNKLGHD